MNWNLVHNHLYVSSSKKIFVNAKILILSYKISIFIFMKIVLEQRYFEMIAPLMSLVWVWDFFKTVELSTAKPYIMVFNQMHKFSGLGHIVINDVIIKLPRKIFSSFFKILIYFVFVCCVVYEKSLLLVFDTSTHSSSLLHFMKYKFLEEVLTSWWWGQLKK